MFGSKKWYAVYTRPGQEKKVADILTRSKIENYCPLNKRIHRYGSRKIIAREPLFTSYVFARITENEVLALKQTVGVINLVYWVSEPAVIGDGEIEMIKRVLDGFPAVRLEKMLNGPVMGQGGKMVSKNQTIKIILPSLGYLLIAEAETADEEGMVRTIAAQTDLPYPVYSVK